MEYTTQQDGSVLGVSVSRTAMLAHARTLTLACNYTEGEIMVCVLDFKRDVGLWHGVLASVFNGMHVIFIPYALMKVSTIDLFSYPCSCVFSSVLSEDLQTLFGSHNVDKNEECVLFHVSFFGDEINHTLLQLYRDIDCRLLFSPHEQKPCVSEDQVFF